VPKVNVFIRSHVHYFAYCGDEGFHAFITPALQGWGSKYGERQCEGTVGFGFMVFDIASLEDWGWKPYVFRGSQRATVSKY
jgi:hypothetical protein